MKLLLILLILFPVISFGQDKWWKIDKNDIGVMACEIGAGYAKGWGDQVEYRHYELSQRFPGLFRNGNKFWDGREDSDGIWDAKHMMSAFATQFHIAAVCIKIGDLKSYKRKDRWKKIAFDAFKYYAAYHLGFFLSWNVTHGNKLF